MLNRILILKYILNGFETMAFLECSKFWATAPLLPWWKNGRFFVSLERSSTYEKNRMHY